MTTESNNPGRWSLAAGGIAALLASLCCIAPLLLVSLGLSGAWMGNFTALAPYRPIFVVLALAAMALAWWRIYRSAPNCEPGQACANPATRRRTKVVFWIVSILVATALLFPLAMPLFY